MTTRFGRLALTCLALWGLVACGSQPVPANYVWVDWTEASLERARGAAADVTVTYTGDLNRSCQVEPGGTVYWASHPESYRHPDTGPGPSTSDVLRMYGGRDTGRQVIRFSRPVRDPIMAVMSVGQADREVRLVFETEVEILTSGPGYWSDRFNMLRLADDRRTVHGREGYGLLRFPGTHLDIAFTIPDRERDYGLTLAIQEP